MNATVYEGFKYRNEDHDDEQKPPYYRKILLFIHSGLKVCETFLPLIDCFRVEKVCNYLFVWYYTILLYSRAHVEVDYSSINGNDCNSNGYCEF